MNITSQLLKNIIKVSVLTGSLLAIGATSQAADFGTYKLSNHPDGGISAPFYGLRLDGLLTGDSNDEYTFDFEHSSSDVLLNYKPDGTIEISGKAFGGEDIGTTYKTGTTAVWDLNFVYQNVSQVTGDDDVVTSIGEGSVSSAEFGNFDLISETGNHSFAFRFGDKDDNLGHRGYDGISGWGWVNHAPDTTMANDAENVNHLYASDWLFTAVQVNTIDIQTTPVPEPTTILGLLGAISFGLVSKRKRNKL